MLFETFVSDIFTVILVIVRCRLFQEVDYPDLAIIGLIPKNKKCISRHE